MDGRTGLELALLSRFIVGTEAWFSGRELRRGEAADGRGSDNELVIVVLCGAHPVATTLTQPGATL